MRHISSLVPLPFNATFPAWTGLKAYMLDVVVGEELPKEISSYQSVFDAATACVPHGMKGYLMIDEGEVKQGQYHRRPGRHVDGYWNDGHQSHGRVSAHGGGEPIHQGYPVPGPRHGPFPSPQHRGSSISNEGLILVSSTGDAAAYVGEFERDFVKDWRGGDVSDLSLYGLSAGIKC